jgi:sporulation protein YlmC with PRC-barrel domain
MAEARMARQSPIVKTNKEVIGRKVINPQGENLGKVEEVMVDAIPGRVAYAVLSFGGFLGVGDKLFAVPWQALDWNPQQQAFVINADKRFLEKCSRLRQKQLAGHVGHHSENQHLQLLQGRTLLVERHPPALRT